MKSVKQTWKAILPLLLMLIVIAFVNQAFAQGAAWETKTPMPTPRHGPAVGAINGKLHVVAGFNAGSISVHEVYDPATNSWSSAASSPTARNRMVAGVIDGKLHVVGGTNPGGHQAIHEVYDPSTNTWATLAPMLRSRTDAVSGVIGGKLFVAGGIGDFQGCQSNCLAALTSLEVYDPSTNSWTLLASMSTQRYGAAGGAIDGKLYVAGGTTASGTVQTSLEVYDPVTDTWTLMTPMPTPRSLGGSPAAAVIDGKLYVAGGIGANSSILDTLEVYDPQTDTWTTLAPMPTARTYLAADQINGVFFVPGGSDGTNVLATLEIFAATQFTLTLSKAGNGAGTVSSSPAGIDCGSDCTEAYNSGVVVALTPLQAPGSVFAGWGGDADCGDGVVTMSADRACSATFSLIGTPQFTLTVRLAGSGHVTSSPAGIDCGFDCIEAYQAGAVIALVPAPAAGSDFFGWGGDADCVDGLVTMSADRACVAVFNRSGSTPFPLTVLKIGTGTGSVVSAPAGITCGADCTEVYFSGTDVLLAALPGAGSTFVRWGGAPDCLDGIVTVTATLTCTAEFASLNVEPVGPESLNPAVSDDGRFVAFESAARNLTDECASGRQIYVRDRATGGVQCVSRTASGPGTGASSLPSISGDGRVVAFQSAANLVSGCTTNGAQVFVRRVETGEMLCASVGLGGAPANASSGVPALSRDGRYVAFESDAINLVPACTNGATHVYVRDLAAQTTVCVSLGPTDPGDLASGGPAISRDGGVVVFRSNARNFTGSGCAGGQQVYAWDRATGVLTCLSRGPDGTPGNAASLAPAVSDSGTLVAFESDAMNLAPQCRTGVRQIYVHDRATATVRCVSRAPDGQPGNDASTDAALSGNGLVVAFATEATNLTPAGGVALQTPAGVVAQAGGLSQIIRESSAAGAAVLELLSQAGGNQGNGLSRRPALDRTGAVVAFQTTAANLLPNDTNGVDDVVVVTREAPPPGCPTAGRPCLTSPLDFSQFPLPTAITFAWTAVDGAAFYGFEFTGTNLQFTNPNAATPDTVNGFGGAGDGFLVTGTTGFSATLNASLTPGTYQVRVIAIGTGEQIIGTFSNALTVILGNVPSPVAASARVTLTEPATGSVATPGGPVLFVWTPLVGVERYLLEVAGPNRPFAMPNATTLNDPGAVGRFPVVGTTLAATVPLDVPPGAYQVRVIGLSPAGAPVGSFSDAVTVSVP